MGEARGLTSRQRRLGRPEEPTNPITLDGILLVDKPAGITSHDAVEHIRRAAQMRRVGHTGTLDPAATGLLILCLGKGARLSEFLTSLDKVYEGAMRLGITTDSYDLNGQIVEERQLPDLDESAIQRVFDQFTGEILQVPPMVSAVRVGGERLYEKARKGEVVERVPRRVTVSEFSLRSYDPADVYFVLRCSRGTYARALCHDVGQALGCGAALVTLRRTWVGHHSLDRATPLAQFQSREGVIKRLVPIEEALDLPSVAVRGAAHRTVASGGVISREHLVGDCPVRHGWVQIKAQSGELLAVGQVLPGRLIQPKRVFCSSP